MTRLGGFTSGQVSGGASVSSDGRYIAFQSNAQDLDGDSISDVFVYDRTTCSLELVSVSSSEIKGTGSSGSPSISDDGRFVAFVSIASNLVVPDANGGSADAFVRDRQLGITYVVSLDSLGVQPATDSATDVSISANGQVIAFISSVTTLVAGDTNAEPDVFVRDLVSGTIERVSVSTTGQQGDSPFTIGVFDPVLSDDGSVVAFVSSMNTLVSDDFNDSPDIFVRNRAAGTTVRATLRSDGTESFSLTSLSAPSLTGDGRLVAFSVAREFVPGNTACDGLYVRDLVQSTTTCPALDLFNATTNNNARGAAFSADGRYLAFASASSFLVPGDLGPAVDVFVHDRTTGFTRRANVTRTGAQASASAGNVVDISSNGLVVAFESGASNLVSQDPNGASDVFASAWTELPSAAEVDLTRNGSFTSAMQLWQTFATPDPSYIVANVTAGELLFYRQPPPPGTSNQAVVFQQTGAQIPANAPLEARFRLGNSSSARRRISVLIHDGDFSDLSVCTFWLAAGAPMREYRVRTHTTEFWANATIAFYAATAGFDGGYYRVDDVSLAYQPVLDDDITDCWDPTAPPATGGSAGPTLLTNGDFSAGLDPWTTFRQITWQLTNSVFEFVRPPGAPAGVVLQATGQPLSQNDVLTALVYLGNSSSVRKRVTLILHDNDFSDLSACTFWLAPALPLSPHVMRTFATRNWTNATLSLYPSTVGADEWIRFTDAVLQVTPAVAPSGTTCIEPGGEPMLQAQSTLTTGTQAPRLRHTRAIPPAVESDDSIITAHGITEGVLTLWQQIVDLRNATTATLRFQSLAQTERSAALVQVSDHGVDWITLAQLPSSEEWMSVEVDLSAVIGRVRQVRLALHVHSLRPGQPPDSWRVRQVTAVSGR